MTNEKLIAALSDIDDEMIADAAPGRQYGQTGLAGRTGAVLQSANARDNAETVRGGRTQRRSRFYRIAALAACFCVVVAVLAVTGLWRPVGKNYADGNSAPSNPAEADDRSAESTKGESDPTATNAAGPTGTNGRVTAPMPDYTACEGSESMDVDEDLPKIGKYPVGYEDVFGYGAGGGFIYYCPAGTTPGAGFVPASNVPDKLAVYWQKEADPAGYPQGLDKAQMTELLNTYAERIGLKTDTVSEIITENEVGSPKKLTALEVKSGDTELRVEANAHVRIILPEDAIPEDINSILQYNDPVIKDNWSYRGEAYEKDSYGGYSSTEVVYVKTGLTVSENGDTLKYAAVSEPSSGSVVLHIFDYSLVTEKVEDYPVISPSKALEMLKEGRYCIPVRSLKDTTTAFPGEDQIVGLRLVYPLSPAEEYIAPYYVFTVMLPDVDPAEQWTGLTDAEAYTEYYIPAIDERYFETPALTPGT